MRRFLWLVAIGLLYFLATAMTVNAKQLNYGGSNHFFYATGTSDGFNTNNNWYMPALNVRPIVGTYQLNQSAVQSQMNAAYLSGQRVYVLPIWTGSIAACEATACNDGVVDGVWGEVINYEANGLNAQHQTNLKAVLAYANQLGFKRMIIRFNHQETPWNWTAWDESKYSKIWNYMVNTRSLTTNYRNQLGSQMELLYDLGGELGGVNVGQGKAFTQRLWGDYVYSFGNTDTLGFSFAYAPGLGRVQNQISWYLGAWYSGVLPKYWAFDNYPGSSSGDSGTTMTSWLNSIMQDLGQYRNQPIIILETWFNDASVRTGIQNAINANRLLNIDTLVQWPTTYGASHFSASIVNSLASTSSVFGNYLPLMGTRVVSYSSTNANVMAIADQNCGTSANLPCSVKLVLGVPPAGKQNVVYVTTTSGPTLVACQGAGDVTIPWIGQFANYKFENYQTSSCPSAPPTQVPSGVSTLKI
jgi:hypothetical protein